MLIGVVADDVTGANDIGIMFSNGGCHTNVFSIQPNHLSFPDFSRYPADVVVLDTNSRLDSGRLAYQKVYEATQLLKNAGCQKYFNKTCSVFRGNIGAEFDAMLDALDLEFAVIVLGFPKNGRITIDGMHYVHGKKLEDSEFRNDPIHPMRNSNLVEILQSQTKRKVALLKHDVVSQGKSAIQKKIDEMQTECNYLIIDVMNQESLTTIADAVCEEPVLCGSSALGELLPAAWDFERIDQTEIIPTIKKNVGILTIAASLTPQTARQIEFMKNQEVDIFQLKTIELFFEQKRVAYIQELVEELSQLLLAGRDVILHSGYQFSMVEKTRTEGFKTGLSLLEISRLITDSMAEITSRVVEKTGQNCLIVAGGETSAAVCQHLGVSGMRVLKEIEPGLPSCVSLEQPYYALILKSGSFGSAEFFEKSLKHLREL
jgi:uncharacterized protein YgbK (DUF1537 family)